LKPSNVLVATQENQPVPKIIDFGVAKATTQKLTESTMYTALGELIGTPEYMSPEQAEMTGEDVDTRTDVYSLGIILYELLAGSLPFEPTELRKAGFAGIIRTIREQDPPRPSTKVTRLGAKAADVARARRTDPEKLKGQLRGDLDWITMQALEKDRTLRYGSAAELAMDLQRHLKHEPVLASPPSATYRMKKFVRRHRLGVSFAAVVAILLAAFAVTMALQADRIAHERDRANLEAQRANREAERANEEAVAAQEVTDFLVGLFDASDPRVALGDTITAREIMDLGAERIEAGDVAEAPLQQARLLETMARVYQNLSVYPRAGELLEKAVAVRRREQGDNHPDVARSLSRLGWLRGAYQRNLEGAGHSLLEAVAILEEIYGPNHIETAWGLYYLGSALSFGQCANGREYLHRARVAFEDTLGAAALPVSWCWNDIGNSFWDTGEYERALECYQRSVEIKEQLLPSDHPDLTTSASAIGGLLMKLGRCEEAQPIVESTLQFKVETLGWTHDHTASGLLARGDLYRCLGRYDEAREDVNRALEIYRVTQGEEYELYASGLHDLSLIALETGHFSEADSLSRVALRTIERTRGPDSAIMAEILEERVKTLRRVGRESEATTLENRVKAIRARQQEQMQARCQLAN
ncbi:MAG: tetratricopeptide repeat protein, partial [Candidatus Latescibacterota bacterium]